MHFMQIVPIFLPDQRLQDEGRRTLLELQFFVMQSFGVGAALGRSLAEQHDAVVVSEGQRSLGERTNLIKIPPKA